MLTEYRHGLWAVDKTTLEAVRRTMATGSLLDPPDLAAAIEAAEGERALSIDGGVAVISLRGLITPSPSLLSLLFGGGGGLQAFRAQFREAVNDADVSAIVLNIDSPGGRVDLVPETAAEIMAARGTKPIVAVANTMAASAAYWIAAAADEIVVSPSADVGSVGVYMLHEDWSGFNEQMGIDPTYIHAGKYKVEGNIDEPLSEEAKAAWQEDVNEIYGMFVNAVSKGRGVKASAVRSDFGEGRMKSARKAVAAGMADRVATLEDTVAKLMGRTAGRRSADPEDHSEERAHPAADGQREMRTADLAEVEVRSADDGGITVRGYAAVFNSESENLGGFIEVIERGAFRKVLRGKPDVRFIHFDHKDMPLARTTNGTLRLSEDAKGLRFEADLSDTQPSRDLATAIEREDINQMSFRFRVEVEGREWVYPEDRAELPRRRIHEFADLIDVSPVAYAAYSATEVELRSAICGAPIKTPEGKLDPELVSGAVARVHAGELVATDEDRRELERAAELAGVEVPWSAPDEARPDAPAADPEPEADQWGLASRQRRLRAHERDRVPAA